MNLTISTTYKPATDLGFLLMKHPDNVHRKTLSFGEAILFFPEVSEERCTMALVLDVDPVGLVRGTNPNQHISLFTHYVTDRPFAVTSFMSVAISRLLGTAMAGKSRDRQALADTAIPFDVTLSPLPCRGGAQLLNELFEPLGYSVDSESLRLDEKYPNWGDSAYYRVRLSGSQKLSDLLTHLFVLIPVLDNSKHYWVGSDEIEKLISKGKGWLEEHPCKDLITLRYLKHRRNLTRQALEQIRDETSTENKTEDACNSEEKLENPVRLNDVRMDTIVQTLKSLGAQSVVDLGCGEGKLISQLMADPSFNRILGIDVSPMALGIAHKRLNIDNLTPRQKNRIELAQGSLIYVDERLKGYDAAACVEVIEHMEPDRLGAFEQVVFVSARPTHVIISTPNKEYNVLFTDLKHGEMRHNDHRFEWTRAEFQEWAMGVAERNGYSVKFESIGEIHVGYGAPTQMGVFSR